MKKCIKCGVEAEITNFSKRKDSKDGFRNECKVCEKIRKNTTSYKEKTKNRNKQTYLANPDKFKLKTKLYCLTNPEKKKISTKKHYNTNKEKILEQSKEYRKNNPEKRKNYDEKYRKIHKKDIKERNNKWLEKNLNYSSEYNKKHYIANKTKKMAYSKEYKKNNKDKINKNQKENRKKTPNIQAWRKILESSLKRLGQEKQGKTIDLLGYSAIELKQHIAKLFTEGMSWNNHGEWHIDHIKPVSKFDKDTIPSIVNALSNLQPLWATTREINGVIYEGNLNKSDIY
jgi:hypothetical protein